MKNYIDHNRMPIIYGDWIVVGLTSLAHELQNIYEIYFCSSVGNGVGRGSRGKFCGLTTIVYSYL